jgi:hypothetical protein
LFAVIPAISSTLSTFEPVIVIVPDDDPPTADDDDDDDGAVADTDRTSQRTM